MTPGAVIYSPFGLFTKSCYFMDLLNFNEFHESRHRDSEMNLKSRNTNQRGITVLTAAGQTQVCEGLWVLIET